MSRKLIAAALVVLIAHSAHADFRYRAANPTSVIEDAMCIPELNGEGFLHVDEDVSGLVIAVVGDDGAQVALYDAGTEFEDVAAPGTGAYTAPSANNVRVSPSGIAGGDCTEMQFADAVYNGQQWVTIKVSDGQSTIMDFERLVYLNFGTNAAMVQNVEDGISNADLPNNTEFQARTLPAAEYATLAGQGDVEEAVGTVAGDVETQLECYWQLSLRSDAAIATDCAAQLAIINADEGSGAGSFANTTDSLEAADADRTTIVAHTNELQTDWANGGRLDSILDARASQVSVDTIDDFLDTEIASLLSAVSTVDGKLDTVDGVADAIKAKTDQLTFTKAGEVDSNDQSWGGVEICITSGGVVSTVNSGNCP